MNLTSGLVPRIDGKGHVWINHRCEVCLSCKIRLMALPGGSEICPQCRTAYNCACEECVLTEQVWLSLVELW